MLQLFIKAIGIHSERCPDMAHLAAAITDDVTPAACSDRYASPTVRLDTAGLAAIDREDRSTLNEISTSVLNAISDAFRHTDEAWIGQNEDTLIFTGTDGTELTFNAIGSLLDRYDSDIEAINHLGDLKGLTNPINMLRLLSTNSVYHVSKRIGAHGGGYPTQAMSLSGICAIEDAVNALCVGRAPRRALVVASGNMRSFDSMVVFGKLGLLGDMPSGSQIDPAFGSAALVIERSDAVDEGPRPVAELMGAQTLFAPTPFASADVWQSLFEHARECFGLPDVIVTYANGIKLLEATETVARVQVFPNIPTYNYKRFFGYTGKANNLLDLAAALNCDSIPINATILLCGTGFGFGVGYIFFRKLGKPIPSRPDT